MNKVKITNVTKDNMARLKEVRIKQAQEWYAAHPFATKIHMALNTSFPMVFLQDNWPEIIGLSDKN